METVPIVFWPVSCSCDETRLVGQSSRSPSTGIVRFRGQPSVANVERPIEFLTLSGSAFPTSIRSTPEDEGSNAT